jgi:hypothetical protein
MEWNVSWTGRERGKPAAAKRGDQAMTIGKFLLGSLSISSAALATLEVASLCGVSLPLPDDLSFTAMGLEASMSSLAWFFRSAAKFGQHLE